MLYVSIFQLFLDPEDESTTPELTTAILQARAAVGHHLSAAVAALRNLRSVSWLHGLPEPLDITTDCVRALGTLRFLTHFEFHGKIDPNTTLSFQPLSNLRSVTVSWKSLPTEAFFLQVAQLITRSPNLQELTARNLLHPTDLPLDTLILPLPLPLPLTKLDLYGIRTTPDDVRTRIQHFRNLTTLVLVNSLWKLHESSLWPYLGEHTIHLKSLSTDAMIYPLLSDYLMSYTGLRELNLWAKHTDDDSGSVVDRFYSILAHHHRTLERAHIRSSRGKAWTQRPTDAQLEGILKCHKLKDLSVYLSFTREELESKNKTPVMIWLQAAMQLPELRHLRLCMQFGDLEEMAGWSRNGILKGDASGVREGFKVGPF
ncbi:hypothetical protein P691DRAFT_755266 [Macrolepiota fuliginosa MF-IS2]|uniref:F-box domain-containing protein n=1 Tax=Macrolepiota fuliginosa MF-IS2 TaxID=1400762 RepID=A0A9P6C9Z9_9AGAR|nr:hypothetical protein P691DRAFT_755266 [Macrolepiota fuliginosa MF-IS2]